MQIIILDGKAIQKELKTLTGSRRIPRLFIEGVPFEGDIYKAAAGKQIYDKFRITSKIGQNDFATRDQAF